MGKNYIKSNIGDLLYNYVSKNQHLTYLNLEHNELLIHGVKLLYEALYNHPNLKYLNLRANAVKDEGL